MEPIKFRIRIKSPIGLTIDLQKDIYCSIIPKYRLIGIELHEIDENIFDLIAFFHPEDINPETDKSELFMIRDKLLSLLSITLMTPVELYQKGVFTFPLGERKYQALSLGAMERKGAPVPLYSMNPLVKGLSLPPKYAASVYYIWQAINANEPLYRFINTAICVELIAGADSPEERSVHPKCTCNYMLEKCPKCERNWSIPNTLRNMANFLIIDDNLLTQFIKARNRVFHGRLQTHDANFLKELAKISVPVLLAVRNYIGGKIGLAPMEEKDLSLSFHQINLIMSVFFTDPEPESD